jgi:hypothetical protein
MPVGSVISRPMSAMSAPPRRRVSNYLPKSDSRSRSALRAPSMPARHVGTARCRPWRPRDADGGARAAGSRLSRRRSAAGYAGLPWSADRPGSRGSRQLHARDLGRNQPRYYAASHRRRRKAKLRKLDLRVRAASAMQRGTATDPCGAGTARQRTREAVQVDSIVCLPN